MIIVLLLSCIGIIVSVYAYLTEQKIKRNPQYKPVCDLSDTVSCSKPLQSQYAHLLGISNSLAGILFYITITLLAVYNAVALLLVAAMLGAVVSFYLAYILFAKIKSFCLVCISVYTINLLILLFALINWCR